MHRSKLQAVVIDCDDLESGIRFWSRALGVDVRGRGDPYVELGRGALPMRVLLQRVPEAKTTKSRVHLDLEADNVEAEVTRLEGLGARRGEQVESWWIMEDPCGNEFCVVPASSDDFAQVAHVWEG